MGSNTSSMHSQVPPAAARYQSSTIPDSFFNDNICEPTPPPYSNSPTAATTQAPNPRRVVFKSSDDKLLYLEWKDVEATTGALVPSIWRDEGMVIVMPETEAILKTLFEFVGARRHPKLLNEKFERLSQVAKSAEKYKIYSAMNICSERMLAYGDRHPRLVLLYAAHNDYPHIFDAVAPWVVTSESLERLSPLLTERLRLPWLRYYALWAKALTEITKHDAWWPYSISNESCWRNCKQQIFLELSIGVHALGDLEKLFVKAVESHTSRCSPCLAACLNWRKKAEEVINGIGVFSEKCLDRPLKSG